jgi:hypothetical protein
MVWKEPVSKWSKEFGLSDVGFAKICKKMKIPLPGRGHWSMVKKGLNITPPILKPTHDKYLETVEFYIRESKVNVQKDKRESDPLVLFEMMPENKITVPERISSKHSLINMAEMSIKDKFVGQYGRVFSKGLSSLNIYVSKELLTRALKIMNTLFIALEKREMKVFVKDKLKPSVTLSILGEELEFRIEEHSTQVEHQKTKEEIKNAMRYPELYSRITYDYVPSGKLHFSIVTYTSEPIRKSWYDTKSRKIEDCLNEIIVGFIKAAGQLKKERLEREKEEYERRAKQRQDEEIQRQKEEERKRYNNLLKQTEAWSQSQSIINFIEHVKDVATQKYGEIKSGSELEKWMIWANKIAQSLDPTSEIVG